MKSDLLHITLSMLRIEDDEGVNETVQALKDIERELNELVQTVSFKVSQLDTFGQRVLFAKVYPDPNNVFMQILSLINRKISQCSRRVQANNKFEFVPHMTLVKVSRPVARARHSKYIPSRFYENHADDALGVQKFDNLQLCVIDTETRPSDGFYHTLHEIDF